MECAEADVETKCWTVLQPPAVPPAPPLPPFLSIEIIRSGINSSWGCDLCFWADPAFANTPKTLPFVTLIIIVAIVSALTGASLTAAFLNIRRYRNRRSEISSISVRHLTRKHNDSSRVGVGTSSLSAFASPSSVSSENTYCEGPYNEKLSCNVYAELHPTTSTSSAWNRPPLPTPPIDKCYLELDDLPSERNSSLCKSSTTGTSLSQLPSSSSSPVTMRTGSRSEQQPRLTRNPRSH